MTPEGLANLIRARADGPGRFLVALAGPPAAGKSTLAAELAALIGTGARVVPMDGFHYDDAVLTARGLRSRKGAPETFDAAGFHHLLRRLKAEDEVAIPLFDRSLELSRGSADIVGPQDRILIIEGNWLLLNEAPWRDMHPAYDLTVLIDVPQAELVRRLQARWRHYGKTDQAAADWIAGNDLPNALRVVQGSTGAEIVLRQA